MTQSIQIPVRLSAKCFRRYCAFDALTRQRRWYWPLLLSMALITASLAGLFGWLPMSDMLKGLLMGLGLAVLMVNLGLYAIQIEAQVVGQHLKDAPLVYTLRLDGDGVQITNGQKEEPPVSVPWNGLWAAFRHRGDIYLYIRPDRALILPEGQANVSADEVWSFVEARLGPEKCFDRQSPRAG